MVKKIIAMVLVLGVIGGIIGCSSGETGPADKGTATATAGGTTTTTG